jgi:monoamine oxidase
MERLPSEVDVAVVGAGAAGLGAGRTLADLGVDFVVLEGAHRVGGRGYTEEFAPGVHFDFGCHWMHSASLNPFVAIAEAQGFTYHKTGFPRTVRFDGRWASEAEERDCDAFYDRCNAAIRQAAEAGRDVPVAEMTERESRWTPLFDYWTSLLWSRDSDQVSTIDYTAYRDTDENWPLKQGYGNLISTLARELPIALNTAVSEIDRSGKALRLTTARGTIKAKAALVTVSTGILGSGDIRFTPELPDWKQDAISALPLGNHNRIGLLFDRNVFGEDHPKMISTLPDDAEPMSFRLRPFGYDYAVGLTGGRFADWLERAGIETAVELATERLKSVFGSGIARHIVGHKVSAWRGDGWVKGAYSAAHPGQAHQRARLAEAIDERLFFAGEATSPEFYCTAHGAYLTGIAGAKAAVKALGLD